MEPKGERTRAMEFFSRLRYSLRRVIRLSGINPLPQTRQAMVSLATRMWEEIKHDEKDPNKRDPKKTDKPEAKDQAPTNQRNPPRYPTHPREGKADNRPENRPENRPRRPRRPGKFASGENEKGERICFVCGSTEHLALFHKKKDDKEDTGDKKPGVHVVRTASR